MSCVTVRSLGEPKLKRGFEELPKEKRTAPFRKPDPGSREGEPEEALSESASQKSGDAHRISGEYFHRRPFHL